MCDLCKNSSKITVDKSFFYDAMSKIDEEELEELIQSHKAFKTKGLDFNPDPDLGEGIPSDKEYNHRKELLLILLAFYAKLKKIDGSNKEIESKIKSMQAEVKPAVKDSNNYNKPVIRDRFDEGFTVTLALINEKLEEANKELMKKERKQPRRNAIVTQQSYNAESIYNSILDGIKRKYYYNQVMGYYPKVVDAAEDDDSDWFDNLFRDAIARLDLMGMYGFNESYRSGYMEPLIIGMAFSFLKIEVYWITAGDSRVCVYCRIAEKESPYPPDKVPAEHTGGRCGLETIIIIV